MAQTTQHSRTGTAETAWLSKLVAAFEIISDSHAPCAPIGHDEIDRSDMAALMANLRRSSDVVGYAMAG